MLPVYLILLFNLIYEWLFLILNFIPECSMPYVDGIFLITCYLLLIIRCDNRNNKGNAFALILKAKKEGTRVFDLLNYSSRVHVNLEFHQNNNFN